MVANLFKYIYIYIYGRRYHINTNDHATYILIFTIGITSSDLDCNRGARIEHNELVRINDNIHISPCN